MRKWKWNRSSGVLVGVCLGLVLTLPIMLVGCFPTIEDVNRLTKADHEFVAEEHKAIRDQMTTEHAVQTPEFSEDLIAINDNYMSVVTKLRVRVDKIEAKGISLGEPGNGVGSIGIEWILGLFNLGWLYPFIKGFGKSRASNEVAKVTEDVTAIKLELATAARPGASVPSDAGKS